ncbi:hypothetical protein [Pelagibius litoralis]|nr:hypothetical protein [Pelagibius litoralis]
MYIELGRQFVRLSREDVADENFEASAELGLVSALSWSDLLVEYRVVILASAGTGKTMEISNQCEFLRAQGHAAVFLRLEHLANDWGGAFEIGDHEELESAVRDQKECWVFLDSIDEARLSNPQDFESAIRRLRGKIKNALQTTHIVVTSRIGAWRPTTDASMLNAQLRYKAPDKPDDVVGSDDDSPGPPAEDDQSESQSPIRYFTLRGLTAEQMRTFAMAHGVGDADNLVQEIEREDVFSLANRPKDLEDIIEFWRANGRLGSRFELVEANVARKLTEADPNRAQVDPLSREKALAGAKRLAAAVSMMRQARIFVPDSKNPNNGVKIETVQTDWTSSECLALLARPVFEPETYGFVRFHHRDTLEYLAARWFEDILRDGNSRTAIEGLFFVNQYGIDVVVPKLRPILAWLALMDDRIMRRIVKNWPEILFEGGDPSRLPLPVRQELLQKICTRYAEGETSRISVDHNALQRLVRPDVADTVRELHVRYAHGPEIRSLLLRSIELGPLKELSDIAASDAQDTSADRYTRLAAIRALVATGSLEEVTSACAAIGSDGSLTERSRLSDYIDVFGPKNISPSKLVDLMKGAERPSRHRSDGLNQSIKSYLKSCSIENAEYLIVETANLLQEEPFVEHRHFEISRENSWMLGSAASGCERLVRARHPSALESPSLTIISLTALSHHYGERDNETYFGELVPAWLDLNDALFWYDVEDCRRLTDKKKGERLVDWWRAQIFRDYWRFKQDDFERVLSWIGVKPFLDDRLVALTLAFRLYIQARRPRAWRGRMKSAVAGERELEVRLQSLLIPSPQTEEQKKWKRSEAAYSRRFKKRDEAIAENHATWKGTIPGLINKINDREPPPDGTYWRVQGYLFERMRELGGDSGKWAQTNWRDLADEYGQDAAEAMRDGLMAKWRRFEPEIASEVGQTSNSTLLSEVFSLSGLEIEAAEVADWPVALSKADAQHAARYLFSELNGFPSWFRRLYDRFPEICLEIVSREIEWDFFKNPSQDRAHYVLSDVAWHAQWLADAIAPVLLKFLSKDEPRCTSNLYNALLLIFAADAASDNQIAELCAGKVTAHVTIKHAPIWLAAWVSVRPAVAIAQLRSYLEALAKADAVYAAMAFVSALYGSRSERGIGARENHKSAPYLKELYLLMHNYIRRDEDIERAGQGVYSPTIRDDAQDARNRIFSDLLAIPGKESFDALIEIATKLGQGESEVWMRSYAMKRAESDAQGKPWDAARFAEFAEHLECQPTTHRQLFDLAVSRLQELKHDYEDSDTSPAAVVIRTKDEVELRNYIANELRKISKGRYSIAQEEELPDTKRTDIRFHAAGIPGAVPVELKIADNGWSGSKLFERLENQLCGDYLRDVHSSNGVYLLVYGGKQKTWQHPNSGLSLTFDELVEELRLKAGELIEKHSGIENVAIIGIDLTKRGAGNKRRTPKSGNGSHSMTTLD